MMVRVKVCGITNREDASMAVELGATALGFIFAPGPRQVTPEKAREIIGTLPPLVWAVGVFVDETLSNIREIRDFCRLDLIQFHGDESPETCREMMPRSIKAFRLKDASSLAPLACYRGNVRAILLDTYQQGMKGGTGKTFDWSLAVKARELGIPMILSGGLNPFNVAGAISAVNPWAIDVNSGIEDRPGQKNPLLVRELMESIRRAEP
jgi:phosphoribosylanthranilate isomerase